MKFLKITGVVVGLLVVVFFSLGIFFPAFEYDGAVVVKSTPEISWRTFHDDKIRGKWMDGFRSLTLKKGEHLQPGAVYELVIADSNEVYTMEEEIISIAPPSQISYVLTNDVMKSTYTFVFTDQRDGSTKIESHYK
jgi:uncharacterized protein YndB with AHSA1/START domain